MKSDKIVKLIADAFRVGRAEGLVVGHRDGYSNGLDDGDGEGYDRGFDEGHHIGYTQGYEQALRDAKVEENQDGQHFEVSLEDEENDGECQYHSCTDPGAYDRGWNDGFVGETGLDEDMLKNAAYLAGYACGAADRRVDRETH